MYIYFLLLKIAAFFGHKKAKLLVNGQAATTAAILERQAAKETSLEGAVWFHAASVGEFEQARPIIERLRAEQPARKILLTFFSPSGYELRKNYDKVDGVYYLPFATRRQARKFLGAVQPSMAVFVKYEFWPAYLKELAARNIPTYLISAIFRDDQLFFKPWGRSYLKLLRCFTRIFVQDVHSQELLQNHGIEFVVVAGDTRFDRVTEIAAKAQPIRTVEFFMGSTNIRTINREPLRTIVAGSTWPKDEALLARYVQTHPDTRLILVPHEIHEAHLHTIFCQFDGHYVRYTEGNPMNLSHTRTLLVDAIGFLSSIYQYADVAYIGGGFGVGIHNTLEAAVYGLPVLFGPNYHNFREAKGLIAAGAAISVTDYESFEAAMDKAFAEKETMGAQAKAYCQSELGATQKIYNELF